MFLVSNSLFTLFQHSISTLKEWFEIPPEQETVSRILKYKHLSQHSHAFRPQVLEDRTPSPPPSDIDPGPIPIIFINYLFITYL